MIATNPTGQGYVMLSPTALLEILNEYCDELGEREATELQTVDAWNEELAQFVEARLPAQEDECDT